MPETDLDLLIRAARAAAGISRRYAEQGVRSWDKPDSAGPVTEADLAVNELLHQTLCGARPDYGWLSEESGDGPARLSRSRQFIIDPIDGTRSFIEGARTWAHSLAVAEGGAVTAAVVYLPLLDRLYAAARGQGATLNGRGIGVSGRQSLTGARVLATRPALDARHWPGGVPDIERGYRPSLAYRLCLVAEGRFDAMITLRRTWEWDVAAGALIVAEAGGHLSDRQGAALRFNNPEPLVDGTLAGTPAVQGQVIGALGRGGPDGAVTGP